MLWTHIFLLKGCCVNDDYRRGSLQTGAVDPLAHREEDVKVTGPSYTTKTDSPGPLWRQCGYLQR